MVGLAYKDKKSIICAELWVLFLHKGIVDPLKSMIVDMSRMRRTEWSDRITVETLIELLKILDNLLRYLSEFVKRVLQAKKMGANSAAGGVGGGGASENQAQQAEKLLHLNRPLVSCNQFFISLVRIFFNNRLETRFNITFLF